MPDAVYNQPLLDRRFSRNSKTFTNVTETTEEKPNIPFWIFFYLLSLFSTVEKQVQPNLVPSGEVSTVFEVEKKKAKLQIYL